MYTKESFPSFFAEDGIITNFYRDGVLIAAKSNGKFFHRNDLLFAGDHLRLTRAWAYRMWAKHYRGLPCWLLPALLDGLTDSDIAYAEVSTSSGNVSFFEEDGALSRSLTVKDFSARWPYDPLGTESSVGDDIVAAYWERFA